MHTKSILIAQQTDGVNLSSPHKSHQRTSGWSRRYGLLVKHCGFSTITAAVFRFSPQASRRISVNAQLNCVVRVFPHNKHLEDAQLETLRRMRCGATGASVAV
jgi:hypothetical protein